MKRVICEFENTEKWQEFVYSIESENDPTGTHFDYQFVNDNDHLINFYTWNLASLDSALKFYVDYFSLNLIKQTVEELPDKEWKKIKKKIYSDLEEPQSIKKISKNLTSGKPRKIQKAVDSMIQLREAASACLQELIQVLEDCEIEELKIDILIAIKLMKESAAPAVPSLLKIISGFDPNSKSEVRSYALRALKETKVFDKKAEEVVLKAFSNLIIEAEYYACSEYLQLMETDGRKILPALLKSLENPDEEIKRHALYDLSELGELAAPHLEKAFPFLHSDSIALRESGLLFLKALGHSNPKDTKTEIIKLLETETDNDNIELANEIIENL